MSTRSTLKNRRIIFLVPLGRIAPSGVRRVQDYMPYLTRGGWKCKIFSFDSPLIYRIKQHGFKFVQSAKKLAFSSNVNWLIKLPLLAFGVLIALLGSIAVLLIKLIAAAYRIYVYISISLNSLFSDVVFLQQVTPPEWFSNLLAKSKTKIVFDIDDAVFLIRPDQTIAVLRAAAVASAGSHYNQEFCSSYCNKVIFLPTPVPLDKFLVAEKSVKNPNDNFFNIGWVGSPSTAKYLDIIAVPFLKLVSRYPSRLMLTIVGLGPANHLLPDILVNNEHVKIIPWVEPDLVPELVATFDLGIMPLHNTEWEKGKCGLKALEYMAAGIPVVCSGVGENNYIVNDGNNGCLANSPSEWETKIEMLMNDRELRIKLGQAGRKTIQERYSTQQCFEILSAHILEPLVFAKDTSI